MNRKGKYAADQSDINALTDLENYGYNDRSEKGAVPDRAGSAPKGKRCEFAVGSIRERQSDLLLKYIWRDAD